MEITIEYYIKEKAKQYKTFSCFAVAQVFMKALSENPYCECYGVQRKNNE